MRSRISALALVIIVSLASGLRAATPLEIWPRQVPPLNPGTLKEQLGVIENAADGLPSALRPAIQFQKIFLRILSGEEPSRWRGEIEKFATPSGSSPLESGLREIARAWLARVEMIEIDTVFHAYYRQYVRFPATLAEVESDIPAGLRKDPWGEAWHYEPHPPQGFERLTTQRYQLGPARFPQLGSLKDAAHHRDAVAQTWKITARDIAGSKALEFRGSSANASVAVLQPGGSINECTLLFIGDGWALMAGVDQLFAVTF